LPETVWFESRRHGGVLGSGIVARFSLGGRDRADEAASIAILSVPN